MKYKSSYLFIFLTFRWVSIASELKIAVTIVPRSVPVDPSNDFIFKKLLNNKLMASKQCQSDRRL